MYSWLESEVLALSEPDYLVLFTMLVALFGYLVYFCYRAFKRFRFVDGTATSKIRSAAQGQVELKGLGEWLPGDSINSPFSESRCVWYHCTIDKKQRSGKRTTWISISDECSSHLFRLVDDTGDCIIDPDDAHVIPETDITWYGRDADARTRAPTRASWVQLGIGNYRFRECLIRPATSLYALGWFRTLHSNPSEEFIARQVDDLVRQWKLQPHRYLGEFDFDANGKIQKQEWKAIRAAARKQVLAKLNSENREHHVLSRPQDKRHPYILSATEEEGLVARKKLYAYASASGAFLTLVALAVISAIRLVFPA
ncbi:MAG: hypothetical protein GY815_14360 [Gammaproteobacteria bacterium]|nr:hypothetical protein [Gammaproteobacteria bacterium]